MQKEDTTDIDENLPLFRRVLDVIARITGVLLLCIGVAGYLCDLKIPTLLLLTGLFLLPSIRTRIKNAVNIDIHPAAAFMIVFLFWNIMSVTDNDSERSFEIVDGQIIDKNDYEGLATENDLTEFAYNFRTQHVKKDSSKNEVAKKLQAGEIFQDSISDTLMGPRMVVMSVGRFEMGSVKGMLFTKTVHLIVIDEPFALGQTEVTVKEFSEFVQATGYKTDAELDSGGQQGCSSEERGVDWRNPGFSQNEMEPVVCVSWNDAKHYIAWLNAMTDERYRLPSESEWEYGARAGSTADYSYGDDPKMLCEHGNGEDFESESKDYRGRPANSCIDGAKFTSKVGSYRKNDFGLYDMHGNVAEWMEDCGYYKYDINVNDTKPVKCTIAQCNGGGCFNRSTRGGSWYNMPQTLISWKRGSKAAWERTFVHGFRLARDLQ
ncbi:hypothetical protein A9Q99_19965 [Gammaproteobacteria bacterium 45_16_T64]|nr:hypothetical protein A9Q99_19965 [Gammaproteobacteria bacterium 45_16_T64]